MTNKDLNIPTRKKVTDMSKAGTGMMLTLTEGIEAFEAQGYSGNITPNFDHLSLNSGEIKIFPKDIVIDDIVRFENSSDPDDQSILYAISNTDKSIKGLYIDSYGAYHDELSQELLDAIQISRMINKSTVTLD
ncbi:MAG: hypothetical protein ABL930_07040 [Pseudobdellovibrio sp.]